MTSGRPWYQLLLQTGSLVPRTLLRDGVPAVVEIAEFDTADPVVDGLPDDYFGRIAAEYLAMGNGTRFEVGAASSVLLDARGLHRFAVTWLEGWADSNRLRG